MTWAAPTSPGGVATLDGRLVHTQSVKTGMPCTSDEIADRIAALCRSLAQAAQTPLEQMAWIGVGAPGSVDKDTGVVEYANNLEFYNVPLGAMLRTRLGLPVYVDNDANAAAWGEYRAGVGRGCSSMVMVTLGTGVGGAVVIDGQTWRGTHHLAGDLGHFPAVGAQGEPCTCGRFGHLEAISAGPQIYRRYLALGGDAQVSGTRELETRAEAGDELAAQVYRDSAQALANVLVGLAYTLDPDCIIISGGLANAGKCWWGPLQETFKAQLSGPLENLELVRAQLGSTAPLWGLRAEPGS